MIAETSDTFDQEPLPTAPLGGRRHVTALNLDVARLSHSSRPSRGDQTVGISDGVELQVTFDSICHRRPRVKYLIDVMGHIISDVKLE